MSFILVCNLISFTLSIFHTGTYWHLHESQSTTSCFEQISFVYIALKLHVLCNISLKSDEMLPFMTATAHSVWYPVLSTLFLPASLSNSVLSTGLCLSKFWSFSKSFKLSVWALCSKVTTFSTSFCSSSVRFCNKLSLLSRKLLQKCQKTQFFCVHLP